MHTFCKCGCGRATAIAKQTDASQGYVKGQPMQFVHGHNKSRFRHGARHTPEYGIYASAKTRCTNPNHKYWKNYGGRGIRFLFVRFEQFLATLGPRPSGMTLDRVNNDGHYEPSNVRWATRSQQQRNRRKRGPSLFEEVR